MLDLYELDEMPISASERLSGEEREALRLIYSEDRSYSEAADALDVSEGEVQTRLLRAHRRLVPHDVPLLD
jgi:DNA-directed RNA polymerase specialized sigma24 family protein